MLCPCSLFSQYFNVPNENVLGFAALPPRISSVILEKDLGTELTQSQQGIEGLPESHTRNATSGTCSSACREV